MTITLKQTGTAATHGQIAACSGAAVTADTGNSRQMSESGTGSGATETITITASSTEAAIFLESAANEPGENVWEAGDWAININFTNITAAGDVTLEDIYICRLLADGTSLSTVASETGMGDRVDTFAGATEFEVISSTPTEAATTDRLYIVLVFDNPEGTNRSFDVQFDQSVATPILPKTGFVGHHGGSPPITIPGPAAIALTAARAVTGVQMIPRAIVAAIPLAGVAQSQIAMVHVAAGRLK